MSSNFIKLNNKIILFLLFLIATFTKLQAQIEELKFFYDDSIHIEKYVNFNRDTTYVIRNFSEFNGKTTFYYDKEYKVKAIEATFINGVKNGEFVSWFRNGQKKSVEYFKDGLAHGYSAEWNIFGVKVFEGNFHKGVEDGVFKNWYGNGVLKRERFFNSGLVDGYDREYYINGRKSSVAFYNSNFGEKDGTDTAWYENGNIGHEINYRMGVLHGTRILYYENGGKNVQMTLNNGKRDGLLTVWEPNGIITKTVLFKNDFPVIEESFYKNGNKFRKIKFKENSEIPESWIYWGKNGLEINRKDAPKLEYDYDFSKSLQDENGNSINKYKYP